MGVVTASETALRVATALRRWPLVALCASYLAYVASVAVVNGFFPKIVTGAWYQMNDPFSDAGFTVTLILAPLSIAAWGTSNRVPAHQDDKSTPKGVQRTLAQVFSGHSLLSSRYLLPC